MNLPKFSVRKPITTTMIILIMVIFGLLSFSRLGVDLLPDIEFPTISVATSYTGVMPQDIEETITKPVEDAVATVDGVKSINSTSQEGLSLVMIEFETGVNVDFAAQDVRDKISMIEKTLPSDAQTPTVVKTDLGAMPVLIYGVVSEKMGVLELSENLEDNIKDRLERLEGVASVTIQGGGEREVQVRIEKTKLELYGLTQASIVSALGVNNINNSGGFIEEGAQEFSIRTVGEYQNIEDLKNTILTFKGDIPVYLHDVAEVSLGEKEKRNYIQTNGQSSVLLSVNKQSGGNTVAIADAIKNELPQLQQYIPENTEFFLVMDQSRMITSSIDSTKQSGIIGGLLAIGVIFIFLKNWRPALAITLAIPFSIIATFIPLYAAGYTLNIMTLGGLALGIGMLVDNAVVVIENIYRHLEKTGKRRDSAIIGTTEVNGAIIASTITTVAVFIPMALATGIAGQLSRGLALTIIFALICSLLVAVTAVPMIASKLFRERKPETLKDNNKKNQSFFDEVKNFYKNVLVYSLKHKIATLVTTILLFLGTLGLVPLIGAEFMPSSDQGMAFLQASMPEGTSLTETRTVSDEFQTVIMDKVGDQLISVTSIVGENEDAGKGGIGGGASSVTLLVRFKDQKERTLPESKIVEIIRENAPPVRGLEVSVLDMAGSMMGGGSNPVEIKILGSDLEELKTVAETISQKVEKVEGIRDLDVSYTEGSPEIQIEIDRQKAAYYGLTIGQIGSDVGNYMQGVVATKLREGGDETNIRVRFEEGYRDDLENIKDFIITSQSGTQIKLQQVADIYRGVGPSKIDREDQLRIISVTANIADRDVGSIIDDIKASLENEMFPSGVYIEYGGSFKQMQDTFGALAFALILAIVLVYMVMASQFESLMYPFIVMFEVPLAFIGVGWILFITGNPLSLPAFMGIIMLAGIVVNNAIVLVDYINQLREKGISLDEALIEGGTARLRPILITSTTTLLGMIPMAISNQEGSALMKPMAIVVIGGLLVSTVLTLVVIPVAYSVMDGVSKKKIFRK